MGNTNQPEYVACSFCGKGQGEVLKVIAGPGVYICNECISLCHQIIEEEVKKEGRTVSMHLSRDEALVLFECLSRFDKSESLEFEDKAEQIVLWDIQAGLERILHEPFKSNYDELLLAARERIREPSE